MRILPEYIEAMRQTMKDIPARVPKRDDVIKEAFKAAVKTEVADDRLIEVELQLTWASDTTGVKFDIAQRANRGGKVISPTFAV